MQMARGDIRHLFITQRRHWETNLASVSFHVIPWSLKAS